MSIDIVTLGFKWNTSGDSFRWRSRILDYLLYRKDIVTSLCISTCWAFVGSDQAVTRDPGPLCVLQTFQTQPLHQQVSQVSWRYLYVYHPIIFWESTEFGKSRYVAMILVTILGVPYLSRWNRLFVLTESV